MKKKTKKKNNNQFNIIIVIIVAIILGSFIYYFTFNSNLETSLKKEGYITNKDDAFYKNIVSGNTLDDFYNSISNNQDAYYEEYYLQKNSLDFIELKMNYENKTTANLTITSNLKSNYTEYNYELTGENNRLIIQGDSNHSFSCKPIISENISQRAFENCCDIISNELEIYNMRRKKLMNNQKVIDEINK